MLLDWKRARVRESDGVELSLANAGGHVPFDPSQLVGEGVQQLASLWRNRRDGHIGQRAMKTRQRLALVAGLGLRLPVKPEDGVPATSGIQVSRKHEESIGRRLRPIEESEDPGLGMEDAARRRPHRVDDVFEERHQVGRPTFGVDGAGLTEDVHAAAHLSQRLHDLDGVGLLVETKTRERERDHQGSFEIQRERCRHGVIQGLPRGWP